MKKFEELDAGKLENVGNALDPTKNQWVQIQE